MLLLCQINLIISGGVGKLDELDVAGKATLNGTRHNNLPVTNRALRANPWVRVI
jgi:hypothetical protein